MKDALACVRGTTKVTNSLSEPKQRLSDASSSPTMDEGGADWLIKVDVDV